MSYVGSNVENWKLAERPKTLPRAAVTTPPVAMPDPHTACGTWTDASGVQAAIERMFTDIELCAFAFWHVLELKVP
jgi:hypothetical protein